MFEQEEFLIGRRTYTRDQVRAYWDRMLASAENNKRVDGIPHAVFRIGDHRFAIDARSLGGVTLFQQPSPLPSLPRHLLGVTSIKGRPVSVTDLAFLMGITSKAKKGGGYFLIVKVGEDKTALKVDYVHDITLVDLHQLAPATARLAGLRAGLVLGVIEEEGKQTITVLDANKCLKASA